LEVKISGWRFGDYLGKYWRLKEVDGALDCS